MFAELIRLLSDGSFHSGEELGRYLGVSRSAVWKRLSLLESMYGLELHRVRGRGYRLATTLSLLDAELISDGCPRVKGSVHVYETTDSTNAQALRLLRSGAEVPLLVLAEHQASGRGRRGRTWLSPACQNLCLSLVLRVEGDPSQLSSMSLVTALSVLKTLRAYGVAGVGLKWPNDVYVKGRKIAGILLELTGDPQDLCHVVIGIGLNVNVHDLGEQALQPWTSMVRELGQAQDRSALTVTLVETLFQDLAQLRRHGFSSLREAWESCHIWQGQCCALASGGESEPIVGKVQGVDDTGALRMLVDGEARLYRAGELSLRRIP